MTTVKPFDVTYKLMSTKFKVVDSVSFDEPFLLVTEIHCLSPWKLYIHNSSLNLVRMCIYIYQHLSNSLNTLSFFSAASKCEECGHKQLADQGL